MGTRALKALLLFLLVLGTLSVLEGPVSANKIAWERRTCDDCESTYDECGFDESGSFTTTYAEMTEAATKSAYKAIFGENPEGCKSKTFYDQDYSNYCCYTDDCSDDYRWWRIVCQDGTIKCKAKDDAVSCDSLSKRSEGNWSMQLVCGDSSKDANEQCELPSTTNNQYCSQTQTECSGYNLGTRDSYGNCNSQCGCAYDPFTYSCVKDQCNATCGSYSDCGNKCIGSVRHYSGACDASICACFYQTENCSLKSGWYDTGSWTAYACQKCKPQEFRSYSCAPDGCAFTATQTRSYCESINEGQACQTDPYECKDPCTRAQKSYTCQSGRCLFSSWMNVQPCSPSSSCTSATCSSGVCLPPSLSVSAGFLPFNSAALTIKVGERATLNGTVKCLNGDCGNVYVYAKNTSGAHINYLDGLIVDCQNSNCNYECGTMPSGAACFPSWTLTGKKPGNYPLILYATNTSSLTNYSSAATLAVSEIPPGSISAELSLDPKTVTIGSAATANLTLACSGGPDAYCGNVTSYLYYNGILMKASGDVWTASGNPKAPESCKGMWGGQTCHAIWTVNSSKEGTYSINAIADSDSPQVENSTSGIAEIRVSQKPVGIIKADITFLGPSQITVEKAAALQAEIKCVSSDGASPVACGTVRAYPRQNGTKIASSGPLSTPVPERNCGAMGSSANSICQIYDWNITGRSIGSYAIDVFAYSDSSEVQNGTSGSRNLNVSKNIGSLSIPRAEANPAVIKITNATTFSATIACSASYCGSVSAKLLANQIFLNSATDLSTSSQNPQSCSSFPCSLNWALKGNSEGSFALNVTAYSNESEVASVSNSTLDPLVVEGYNPLLALGSIIPQNVFAGQPAKILAKVSCYVRDCGQVSADLSYKAPGGWKAVPSSGEVYLVQGQNPAVASSLLPGQSKEIAWDVNFTSPGNYELRISANSTAPNAINAEQKGTVKVSLASASKPAIEILAPLSSNSMFLMGDTVLLKARITRDGMPARGLSPVTATIPDLFTTNLYDDGTHNDEYRDDGIYGGSAVVPSKKIPENQYRLIFNSGESEAWIYIYINPTLYVTVNTDRPSYTWGQNITISGDVRKKGTGIPASMTMDIVLMQGNWSDEIKFSAAGQYSYVYENKFMPNINGNLILKATAHDEYGNSGQNSTLVSVTSLKGDSYSLQFSMAKQNYTRGETMAIMAKVYDAAPVAGVKVRCRFLGNEIELNETGGSFSGRYKIPGTAPLREQTLSCSVLGPKPGSGQAKIRIEPIPLKIVIVKPQISPQNVLAVYSGQTIELRAAVMYPDNSPVKDAILQAKIGNKTTNMTYAGIPGFYKSDTIFSGAGMSVLLLQAQDENGNYGESNVSLVVDTGEFNWWWLLLIPAGIALFFIAWRLHIESKKEPPRIQIQEKIIRLPVRERVREIVYRPVAVPAPAKPRIDPSAKARSEIKGLEEKYKTIVNAKDLAEKQYYKRQIDEKTFNKLMQDYEEKLIEIEAAISQKRKDVKILRKE